MMIKKSILKFTSLCDLPIVGQVILCAQLVVLSLRLSEVYYLSGKDRFLSRLTLHLIEKKSRQLTCTSWRFGHLLTYFSSDIHLDVDSAEKINISSTQSYQDVLWTLFSCNSFSAKELKAINAFFGGDIYRWKNQKATK